MAEKVNICIVGASGLIGIQHTKYCLQDPLVNITCIVDPSPAGAELAKKHDLMYFTDVDVMLAVRENGMVKVDGAILATPNVTHVPLSIKMVQAGIHVLVEKPLSTTVESGRSLVAAAEKAGCKILVGHHRRFNSYTITAKKMIDEGKLGRILAVQGTWATLKPPSYFEGSVSWHKEAGSGGTILINVVHDLDLLRHFCGEVVKVYCQSGISTRGFPVDETGAIVLTFENGVVGTFIFSDAAASPNNWEGATGENPNVAYSGETAYTFIGTKGTVSIPQLKFFHYDTADDCWRDPMISDPPMQVEIVPPLARQMQHFVQVCKGLVEPNYSGMEGLKNIILLEAVQESMVRGVPVDIAQS